MKRRYLSILKRILVTALSVSMVVQPAAPVMAASEAEAVEVGSSEDEVVVSERAETQEEAQASEASPIDEVKVENETESAEFETVADEEFVEASSVEDDVYEEEVEEEEAEEIQSAQEDYTVEAANDTQIEAEVDGAVTHHIYDVDELVAKQYFKLTDGDDTTGWDNNEWIGKNVKLDPEGYYTLFFHNTSKTPVQPSGSPTCTKPEEASYDPLPDGSVPNWRLALNGAATFGWTNKDTNETMEAAKVVKFTTTADVSSIKVWWAGNGLGRELAIYGSNAGGNAEAKPLYTTEVNSGETAGVGPKGAGYAAYISRIKLEGAGTYYMGWTGGGANYLYKWDVMEGENETYTEANWATVSAPSITGAAVGTSTITKKMSNIDVTLNTQVDDDTAANEVIVYAAKVPDGQETMTAEEVKKNAVIVNSVLKNGEGVVTSFAPLSSGRFAFAAYAHREDSSVATFEDKVSNVITFDFIRPLDTPTITAVSNVGKDSAGKTSVDVRFTEVKEADYYIVTIDKSGYKGEVKQPNVLAEGDTGFKVNLDTTGFNAGTSLKVKVTAYRNPESVGGTFVENRDNSDSASKEFVTSDAYEIPWEYAAYGTSVDKTYVKNGMTAANCGYYENWDNEQGKVDTTRTSVESVRVWSVKGSGKIVPLSMDGVSFYYVAVPSDKNFKIQAKAHVNDWAYSNGQDGFGVMAADRVGTPEDSDYWNNSFMSVATKSEYRWDGNNYTNDEKFSKVNMYLGISSIGRYGVTEDNLKEFEANPAQAMEKYFTQDQTPLEHFCAAMGGGTYNIVANYVPAHSFSAKKMGQASYGVGKLRDGTADTAKAKKLERSDFIMTVEKNNSGYFVSYTDPVSGHTDTKKYYDPKYYKYGEPMTLDELKATDAFSKPGVLETLVPKYVYAGFFAARNADVTYSDFVFETWDPTTGVKADGSEDVPEAQPPVGFDNNSGFTSASNANTADYTVSYMPTWKGDLEITNGSGKVLFSGTVMPDVSVDVPTTLSYGANTFKATFKTSPYAPGNAQGNTVYHYGYDPEKPEERVENIHNVLNTYADVASTLTVNLRTYGEEGTYLYVSPDGQPSGKGTLERPLDIYTAVKYVLPGQQIVLAGGEYRLSKTVRIERGINGTKDKPITMLTDPSADEPAKLNFLRAVSGIMLGGNYWYLKDFEVTNTADMMKGIQIAGSHNKLENIRAHHCGNNGIDVSRMFATDLSTSVDKDGERLWPHDNLILNCTSYENSDNGFEDADGYACKLTIADGNVFDGCIAYNNADDGWDLYAKSETGPIGRVIIKNSVAYRNGYIHRDNDGDGVAELINAGNGNGFKMGGESINGRHTVINSFAFMNKAKGIDSNSCPDIRAYNCVSYDNESYNIAMYTNNQKTTNYFTRNVISFRKNTTESIRNSSGTVISARDQVYLDGMDPEQVLNETTYAYNMQRYIGGKDTIPDTPFTANVKGLRVEESDFKSLEFDPETQSIGRKADGTIDMGDFLQLTDDAYKKLTLTGRIEIGAELPTDLPEDDKGVVDSTANANSPTSTDSLKSSSGVVEMGENDNDNASDSNFDDVESIVPVKDTVVVGNIKDQYYTGSKITPELLVIEGLGTQQKTLTKGKDYNVTITNNLNAGQANVTVNGIGNYTGKYKNADGSDVKFEILPISLSLDADGNSAKIRRLNDSTGLYENVPVIEMESVIAEPASGKALFPVPTITFNTGKVAKKLSKGNDFTVKYYKAAADGSVDLSQDLTESGLSEAGTYFIVVKGNNTLEDVPVDENDVKAGMNQGGNYSGSRTVKCVLYTAGAQTNIKEIKTPKIVTQNLDINGNKPFDLKKDGTYATAADKIAGVKAEDLVYPLGPDMVLGIDYDVSYANNNKKGNATATIVGLGEKYSGSVAKKFKIAPAKIKLGKTAKFNVEELPTKAEYTGSPITLNKEMKVWYTGLDNAGNQVEKLLTLGKDYRIDYKRAKYAGNATATVKGIGAYKGQFSYKYRIMYVDQASLKEKVASGALKVEAQANYDAEKGIFYRYYTRDDGKISVAVEYNNNLLKEGKDYNIVFSKGKGDLGERTMRLQFMGAIEGFVGESDYAASPYFTDAANKDTYQRNQFKYEVREGKLDNNTAFIDAQDIVWKSASTKVATKFTIYEFDTKKKLTPNKDYDPKLGYNYDSDVVIGDSKVAEANQAIGEKDSLVEPDDNGYNVVVSVTGTGRYAHDEKDYLTGVIHVAKNDLNKTWIQKSIKKEWAAYDASQYTGIELDATDFNKLLKNPADGTYLKYAADGKNGDFVIATTYDMDRHIKDVKQYYNNDKAGSAYVILQGINGWAGTKRLNFNIQPKNLDQKIVAANAEATDTAAIVTDGTTATYALEAEQLEAAGATITVVKGNKFTITDGVAKSFESSNPDVISVSTKGEVNVLEVSEEPVQLKYKTLVDGKNEEGKDAEIEKEIVLTLKAKEFGFDAVTGATAEGLTVTVNKGGSFDATINMQNPAIGQIVNESVITDLKFALSEVDNKYHITGTARRAGSASLPIAINGTSFTVTITVPGDAQ